MFLGNPLATGQNGKDLKSRNGWHAREEGQNFGRKDTVDFDGGEGFFAAFFAAGANARHVEFDATEDGSDPGQKSGSVVVPEEKGFQPSGDGDRKTIELFDLDGAAANRGPSQKDGGQRTDQLDSDGIGVGLRTQVDRREGDFEIYFCSDVAGDFESFVVGSETEKPGHDGFGRPVSRSGGFEGPVEKDVRLGWFFSKNGTGRPSDPAGSGGM